MFEQPIIINSETTVETVPIDPALKEIISEILAQNKMILMMLSRPPLLFHTPIKKSPDV